MIRVRGRWTAVLTYAHKQLKKVSQICFKCTVHVAQYNVSTIGTFESTRFTKKFKWGTFSSVLYL